MTRSPTFSPAAETTIPPRTSGSAAPRPSPPGPTSPASPWLHNHAYRRVSLSPSRFPSICRSQVDGAGRRSRAPTPPGPDKLSSSPAPGDSGPCRGFALIFTATSASKADIALFKHDLPLLLSLLFDRARVNFGLAFRPV